MIILYVIEALFYALMWWLLLPAITIKSFALVLMIALAVVVLILDGFIIWDSNGDSKLLKGSSIALALIFLAGGLAGFFGSPMVTARAHANVFGDSNIRDGSITDYFATLDNIPLTDSKTADNLIIRKMGSLKGEMVSQFEADTSYVITYQGRAYRVSPLKYAGFFQWMNNHAYGIPAYIMVDMTTQSTEIVYLDSGMKYSPSEFFGHDLTRHLRSEFLSDIFYGHYFEIDDDGNPYWITPVVNPQIGLWNAKDVVGVIVTNAITGQAQKYRLGDVPEWVDNVYPTDLLLRQYNWYGYYQDGFLNAYFGKRNAVAVTEGYNYIPDMMDVNIYTGVTSLVMDESNIGFILLNKRTKETIYYEYPGAEEYSAMSSAEGLMQQYSYTATFPLLVNLDGEPTYYLALKDDGGLVKAYSLVNVADYQIVAAEKTLAATIATYQKLLSGDTSTDTPVYTPPEPVAPETFDNEVAGVIAEIRTGDINGTTNFYIYLEDNDMVYRVSLANSEKVILLNVGDEVVIEYSGEEGIVNSRIQ